jgi:hypothetical protein
MHGSVREPDLQGFDPAQRALLIVEGSKTTWLFDPSRSPAELLSDVVERAMVFQPANASLYSMAVQSTESVIAFTNSPQPVTAATERQPAVAGSFYPASVSQLDQLVTEYLGPECPKRRVPAIMVPHAGLKYSGRIAGQVLRQVEIPETVIIIGPKHTRLGVEWAVAPHEKWLIPGAELEADLELARRIVEAIPGLQFDAMPPPTHKSTALKSNFRSSPDSLRGQRLWESPLARGIWSPVRNSPRVWHMC